MDRPLPGLGTSFQWRPDIEFEIGLEVLHAARQRRRRSSGATQRNLKPGCSERIGNSRRTGGATVGATSSDAGDQHARNGTEAAAAVSSPELQLDRNYIWGIADDVASRLLRPRQVPRRDRCIDDGAAPARRRAGGHARRRCSTGDCGPRCTQLRVSEAKKAATRTPHRWARKAAPNAFLG